MDLFDTWGPLLTVCGFLLLSFFVMGKDSLIARAVGAALCICMAARYAYWRILYSLPTDQNILQLVWSRFFLGFECATIVSIMLVQFFLSRSSDRSVVSDMRRMSPLREAPTDVLIATYNEERDILERTIVGAKAIHHSDLRVWYWTTARGRGLRIWLPNSERTMHAG